MDQKRMKEITEKCFQYLENRDKNGLMKIID